VVRTPLPEVAYHGFDRLVVERHMKGIDREDLRPTFAACVFEVEVDRFKSLVDLGIDLPRDLA
jgi:hypothetical protein